jgi:Integrase core domain
VLFERICRENGITQRLTKPRSPTTTGKIERLHQTLQHEPLTVHPPFHTIVGAQAAVDAWRHDYNAARPHQSLGMAFPATRFAPKTGEVLDLRIPAELRPASVSPLSPEPSAAGEYDHGAAVAPPVEAAEISRVVPPSGNLWIAGQQIWLGPALSGRTVQILAGLDRVHVLMDGHRLKTLPSRLDRTDIGRLLASGARPAVRSLQPSASGSVIELDRIVNASGTVSIGGHIISAGIPLAGQRVTLRLDGPVAHIITDGTLARTVACPVPEQERHRLRGARPGELRGPQLPEAQTVKRRVSQRGAIMIGRQRVQVGLAHAGKTAEITIGPDTYHVTVEDGPAITAARTSSRDIRRHKASHYVQQN